MKKFLLIFILLLNVGCELPTIIEADQYIEPNPIELNQNTLAYQNVWDRIKADSSTSQIDLDEKTLEYINNYLSNPTQLEKLIEKGRYFIFFVLEELDRYRLPPELALLPYIESNYDPFSISSWCNGPLAVYACYSKNIWARRFLVV